jgi:hypothetical protein
MFEVAFLTSTKSKMVERCGSGAYLLVVERFYLSLPGPKRSPT